MAGVDSMLRQKAQRKLTLERATAQIKNDNSDLDSHREIPKQTERDSHGTRHGDGCEVHFQR
jgi:type II secretory pathway component PulJ